MKSLKKAEQAILNGIYAAMAWLILDLGFLLQEHGGQALSVLASRPEMSVGVLIVILCIAGLFYKSRVASILLFLLFIVPQVLRAVQGSTPSAMSLLFSFVLLYFFLTAVLGTFSYHHLKTLEQEATKSN